MTNIVENFLRRVARAKGYTVFDSIYGDISLDRNSPITQSSGAVYGIWAFSDSSIRDELLAIPGHRNYFPVYWGKDISPVSRMKAHVQGHRNNGNIRLREQNELQGKRLIYAAILISNYQQFEQLLIERYVPMLGTRRVGSRSRVIEIIN